MASAKNSKTDSKEALTKLAAEKGTERWHARYFKEVLKICHMLKQTKIRVSSEETKTVTEATCTFTFHHYACGMRLVCDDGSEYGLFCCLHGDASKHQILNPETGLALLDAAEIQALLSAYEKKED